MPDAAALLCHVAIEADFHGYFGSLPKTMREWWYRHEREKHGPVRGQFGARSSLLCRDCLGARSIRHAEEDDAVFSAIDAVTSDTPITPRKQERTVWDRLIEEEEIHVTTSIIIAADPTGIIGVNNTLPWRYKADMARFKTLTTDGVVVMGRKTFDSIPVPKTGPMLPNRKIIVVTRNTRAVGNNKIGSRPEVEDRPDYVATSLKEAVLQARSMAHQFGNGKTWIIGGAEVYLGFIAEGLVDEVDFTLVPEVTDIAEGADVVRIPADLLSNFTMVSETANAEDPRLTHRVYRRCSSQESK